MSYAFVSAVGSALGVSGGTSSSANTTGADLIVVSVTFNKASSNPSLSDSKGNTYTALTDFAVSNQVERLYYCQSPTVGSGHTFTFTGTNIFASLSMACFSGSVATPLDVQNGATNAGATSLATGSVTPGANNELVIASVGTTGSDAARSIGGGFTKAADVVGTPSVAYCSAIAYLIETTATAANPTWSWSTSQAATESIAAFKAGGVVARQQTLTLLGCGA